MEKTKFAFLGFLAVISLAFIIAVTVQYANVAIEKGISYNQQIYDVIDEVQK